jgi:hypothetical protein
VITFTLSSLTVCKGSRKGHDETHLPDQFD